MPTLLVTGANRGLGFEFTRQYAADGWNVIACCRTPEEADKLQILAKANPGIRIEKLDVDIVEQINSLAGRLKKVPVDILINCAGIFSGAGSNIQTTSGDKSQRFGSLNEEAWLRVFRTNTIAPIMISQALLNNLLLGNERKIVMISSRKASIKQLDCDGDIAYRTSKTALNAAAKNMSVSVRPDQITVVCISPGWVRTDMGGENADLSPEESVGSMRRVIANVKFEDSGKFFNLDFEEFPW